MWNGTKPREIRKDTDRWCSSCRSIGDKAENYRHSFLNLWGDNFVYRTVCAKFVELKWESDTPAYAAFEVLRYGLVYLFSRVKKEEFGYSDLATIHVNHIGLQVVAPTAYFAKHKLGWPEKPCKVHSGQMVYTLLWAHRRPRCGS